MSALKRGEKGPAVYLLQSMLNSYGNEVVVDGQFGEATEAAVKTFQQEQDLDADGVVGGKTALALAQTVNMVAEFSFNVEEGIDFSEDGGGTVA